MILLQINANLSFYINRAHNVRELFFNNCWHCHSIYTCLYVQVNSNFPQSISISITVMPLRLLGKTECENITKVTLLPPSCLCLNFRYYSVVRKGKFDFAFFKFVL